jgi:hypothetical protein
MSKRPRGSLPNWKPSTTRQKGLLADLITRYQQHADEDTLPRGPRGIFYDLRPNGMGNGLTYRKPDSKHPVRAFGPLEVHPAAVQEVLALARRAGIIPESWVADGHAPDPIEPLTFADADDFAAQVAQWADTFALDMQANQPIHIEVLCEAADLAPRLARVAGEYGVVVYSGGGFDGLKGKRAFAERALRRKVPTFVLHVGDRDDHGDDIYVAAAEDAAAWAGGAGIVVPLNAMVGGDWFAAMRERNEGKRGLVFTRLALTADQARELELLDADGKAEVDGVPVLVMDGWLRDAIEVLQDPARRDATRAVQERERARLPAATHAALSGHE